MANEIIITNKELFTINCKTVYKKDEGWYANPFLTDSETTEANTVIKMLTEESIGKSYMERPVKIDEL